ncbi:MAG: hypothetical protein IT258_04775 [Saprospiraceae bacterium]|nr:hypothetical protein [Saprospiraceae bacterium]
MIREHYTLERLTPYNAYRFESIGVRGVIQKFVIFEEMENGNFNLAFGDIIDGRTVDNVVTNNHDAEKTISTVVKAVHLFFKDNPSAKIEFDAVDERRIKLYNWIFSRRYLEIIGEFDVYGFIDVKKERYSPSSFYTKFEVSLKIA